MPGLPAATLLLLPLLYAPGLATDCSNPIPGIRKLIRGVDVTQLDLVPLEILATNGFRSPVVNFTCSRGRTWTSPEGAVYEKPDQVWHANTIPGGWLSNTVKLYKTSSDVKRSMQRNVGGEGSIWKFSFSGSHSYKEMQNTITNTSRYISDVTAFESATRLGLNPSWVLQMDYFAQMYLENMISGTYTSSPSAYNNFIREFGTHYFSNGNFGGYIRVVLKTDESYVYRYGERETENNAKASFLKVISLHGGSVSGSTTVSSTFTSATTKTVHYYGGQTNLLQEGGIQRWQPTVDADPWLFSGTLRPISDLIRDPVKKSSMIQAVSQYIMRSYLDELQRILVAAMSKMSNSLLTSLQSRLTAMRGLSTLVEADLEALGNDINTQLFVPHWFLRNTKLCYKWRADGDGGQCGGGAASLLCANVNGMTPVYRDDTDGRGGGCRMQWGIQTTGTFPSWFSQVQVCYRWHPDGDGGQCGGGAARLLCANVNSFSPEYRDDTDGRGGGCQMSWRLVVPSTAPLWMKTAQLCYSWYPDGDGGQCGPAPSRNLCATANEWTGYYRDDTDGRGGGCRMSWGIKVTV